MTASAPRLGLGIGIVFTLTLIGADLTTAAPAKASKPAPTTSAPAKPKPVPNNPALKAIAVVRAAQRKTEIDKFASPPNLKSLAGQPFKLRYSLQDGETTSDTETGGFWTYKKGRLRFEMTPSPSAVVSNGPGIPLVQVGMRSRVAAPYVGQNAFGASRRVSVYFDERDYLAALNIPEGEVHPFDDALTNSLLALTPNQPRDTFYVDLSVVGEEARRLTRAVRFEIEGVFAGMPDGSSGSCDRSYHRPEINSPNDVTVHSCWTGARFSRVAFVDSQKNVVIKEWRAAEDTSPTSSPTARTAPMASLPPEAPPATSAVQFVISRPDWLQKPSGDDIARYYPERAQRLEQSGSATIQCTATASGAVANCSVAAEDPADYGFADAALKLARFYKMKPQTVDGKAVAGGVVLIPVAFRIAS